MVEKGSSWYDQIFNLFLIIEIMLTYLKTGIGATAILTCVTPILTKAGTGFLISTRVLEGLFEVRN